MSILDNFCPCCKSTNLLENIQPSNTVHYAKLTCGDCGRHIKWLAKPKTPDIAISRLLHGTDLEVWKRKFLKAIACRSPTKSELIVIQAIKAKVNSVPSGRGSG